MADRDMPLRSLLFERNYNLWRVEPLVVFIFEKNRKFQSMTKRFFQNFKIPKDLKSQLNLEKG
jgi:hypothetical protein